MAVIDTAPPLTVGATYQAQSLPGVAVRLVGFTTTTDEVVDLVCTDDHDHDRDCYLLDVEEVVDTDTAIAVMVGDDRRHHVPTDELTPLTGDDFCPGCGQTGCGHYR